MPTQTADQKGAIAGGDRVPRSPRSVKGLAGQGVHTVASADAHMIQNTAHTSWWHVLVTRGCQGRP
jgi:hypothetical protein